MNNADLNVLAAEKLEAYLREEMREDVDVCPEEVMKINDQHLYGLSIMKGEGPAPTFYVNDMFRMVEHGADMDVLVRNLAEAYLAGRNRGPRPAEDLPSMEFRTIKRKVGLRLVGKDYNREYLKTVPYKDVGNGYALICDVQIKASDGGVFSTVVTNEAVEQYHYDMEKLFGTAMENAWKTNAASLRNAHELICGDDAGDGEDTCYILTTDRERFGAAALFYPGTQAMIAHVLKEDYIAIPSSLHEFIIVRASRVPDLQHMKQMVREANSTIVAPDEVLSDNLLRYSTSTKELSPLY